MIKRTTVYLHEDSDEIEEIYEDAFVDVPEEEHENVVLAIHNLIYELPVVIDIDTETGKYTIIRVGNDQSDL